MRIRGDTDSESRTRKNCARNAVTHGEPGLHSGFSLLILDDSLLTVSQKANLQHENRNPMREGRPGASPFGGISWRS
jgi:hypothetical protein